ncbi:hypothetical protein EMCRGX_G029038 [Ephydatia muelleri]
MVHHYLASFHAYDQQLVEPQASFQYSYGVFARLDEMQLQKVIRISELPLGGKVLLVYQSIGRTPEAPQAAGHNCGRMQVQRSSSCSLPQANLIPLLTPNILNSSVDEAFINKLNKSGIFITEVEDRPSIFQTVALNRVILECKSELDQLVEGLQALNVLTFLINNPQVFEECFVADIKDPNPDDILNLFYVDYSSSNKTNEELTYSFFVKYIKTCEGDRLKKVLSFFSGEETIPSVGCTPQPCIHFSSSLYPSSATCSFELVLPTSHTSFDKFKASLDEALDSNGGFGCR